MKLKCVIIEDEPLARNLLQEYINKVPTLQLYQSFSNPLKAMEVLHSGEIDILFLDVQMPEITGVSLLKILKKKPIVILTTAYSDYAIEGYELDITDYLLKPITFERFLKAIEKAAQRLTYTPEPSKGKVTIEDTPLITQPLPQEPYIFVKDGFKQIKIKLNDIMFVKGLKDYVSIHTPQQKIITLQKLKGLEELLPKDKFIRVHHSYIVSMDWITVVHRQKVEIGDIPIPISDTYRKGFKEFIGKKSF
ncbi:DNA-binding LytR/AlgR family response regulator [Saonia flava]|uniref:DNA-binding LytR/AlgR family response regulator n=1 Tax=Saonia flava TaxID=523696 RepID=A0A846QZ03_9FLAO|nr:LytTR family DNA-binding domain-containing protein [Saonia flava]NJB71433.1 DNA-binding LytR/AlgR family response regulator [Saonia flava]